MKRRLFAVFALFLIFTPKVLLQPLSAQHAAQVKKEAPNKIHPILWMQTSAEYRALCLQTFNSALREIKQEAQAAPHREGYPVGASGNPMAIVMDLDETVLDNSRFQAELALRNEDYSEASWARWVENNVKQMGLLPGARRFIEEVEDLRMAVVYISNRAEDKRAFTIQALAHNGINIEGLDGPSGPRLLLKMDSSSKELRRQTTGEKYHVVAYLGDNLGDFPGDFGPTIDSRFQRVDSFGEVWGIRWFVLPNPVYGDWERVLGKDRLTHLKGSSE